MGETTCTQGELGCRFSPPGPARLGAHGVCRGHGDVVWGQYIDPSASRLGWGWGRWGAIGSESRLGVGWGVRGGDWVGVGVGGGGVAGMGLGAIWVIG